MHPGNQESASLANEISLLPDAQYLFAMSLHGEEVYILPEIAINNIDTDSLEVTLDIPDVRFGISQKDTVGGNPQLTFSRQVDSWKRVNIHSFQQGVNKGLVKVEL
ncbi:hypothetical protein JW887_01140 [Candidatus Dojkabacteria bacterium]|nr:hypothetical protein [Candidatus Dojkabacteria bacterium]